MDGLVVYVVLILAMAGPSSGAWCVCKEGVGDGNLQKTLDYACGNGADCTLIHQNGACYNPNSIRAHCSYAVNSYFQKKGQAQGSCDFAGTATVTTSDPSNSGCVYPTGSSSTSTSTAPSTTTPSSTMPTTPSSTTPTTTTPGTGTGTTITTPSTTTPVGSGSPYMTTPGVLGPSGSSMNTDVSHGGLLLQQDISFCFLVIAVFSGFMLL